MKVIFMGTPDFSVGTLEALIGAGHEVVLVVTQPDKPKGRGGKMQYTPVKEAAVAHGIPVFQPVKIREPEAVEELRKYNADIMVVIAFGQILPKEILDMTPYGCINVHASLLPSYRGAAPIQWAVINGDKVSGVTTMQMNEGLDTGDKTATWEVQGESPTAYAKMLDKKLGDIDWSRSAKSIECLIRGLNPWPSAYTDWNGKVMKIWEAGVLDENTDAKPGTIVKVEKDSFSVQTGDGLLKVLALQIPGKKRMEADAFLRGYQIETGCELSSQMIKNC